jgi:hypothetical protein
MRKRAQALFQKGGFYGFNELRTINTSSNTNDRKIPGAEFIFFGFFISPLLAHKERFGRGGSESVVARLRL